MNKLINTLAHAAMLALWIGVAAAAFQSSQAAEVAPVTAATAGAAAPTQTPAATTPAATPKRAPSPAMTPRPSPQTLLPDEAPTLCACGAPTGSNRRLA